MKNGSNRYSSSLSYDVTDPSIRMSSSNLVMPSVSDYTGGLERSAGVYGSRTSLLGVGEPAASSRYIPASGEAATGAATGSRFLGAPGDSTTSSRYLQSSGEPAPASRYLQSSASSSNILALSGNVISLCKTSNTSWLLVGRYGQPGPGPETELSSPEDQHG